MKAQIEGIWTYKLILDTGYCLDLEKCLYVPSCATHLIFVGKLNCLGFNFKIENGVFHLYKHVSSSKCNVQNENSAFLWHQRLGHISTKRMMRLVKNEILPQLDFGV